jgi:hypothetical protein
VNRKPGRVNFYVPVLKERQVQYVSISSLFGRSVKFTLEQAMKAQSGSRLYLFFFFFFFFSLWGRRNPA